MNESPKRILVVDDEQDVTELLKYKFEQWGYFCETINDPYLFIAKARDFQPDLIIMDVMMPGLNGIQLCRIAQADANMMRTPFIFLTARTDVDDRIKGLEVGAEDYICKPFSNKELKIRVRNILKRSNKGSDSSEVSFIKIGAVTIDDVLHQVMVNNRKVEFSVTEFRLLKLLMERKGRVQSRDNLLVNVWNYNSDVESRTVDTHVRRIREKLGDCAGLIETVRGVGYRAVDI